MRPLIASASPVPSMIVVSSLVETTRRARPRSSSVDALQLAADLLGDDLAAGEDGDVAQHLLAAVAEAGGLDRQDVDRAAQLVDHERRQRLAVDVLGDDHERSAGLEHLLQHRHDVLDALIFLSVIRMYGSSSSASMRSELVTK